MDNELLCSRANRIRLIIKFVDSQPNKLRDSILAALKHEFQVSEKEIDFLIRTGILVEYRGVDENNNGIDFLRSGERGKVFFEI